MPKYDILAAGMIRSGSTLVYQTLKALFPGRTVTKTHDYVPSTDYVAGVCTYRNFIDATISLARVTVDGDDIPDFVVDQAAKQMKVCIDIAKKYADEGKAPLLKYEQFVSDPKFLFDVLGAHFGVSVDEKVRRRVSEENSVARNSERAARLGSYRNFDPESYMHGKHVCTPVPGDARRLVRPEVVTRLEEFFQGDLRLFGYIPPTPR